MKNILSLATALLLSFSISAQDRLILVEHFTNTFCGICASRNPGIYSTLEEFPENVIHLQMNPSVPYSQCPFYLLNTEDNDARRDFYSLLSTPTVYINGVRSSSNSSTLRTDIQEAIDDFTASASLSIQHEPLKSTDNQLTVTYNLSEATGNDLRLLVLLAERNVEFDANNGEQEHPNRFATFITANDGMSLTAGSAEEAMNLEFDIESRIDLDEVYVIAFIQDFETREVLASTSSDYMMTVSTDDISTIDWELYPNPASSFLTVRWSDFTPSQVQLLSMTGNAVLSQNLSGDMSSVVLNTSQIKAGQYLLELKNSTKKAVRKVQIQ